MGGGEVGGVGGCLTDLNRMGENKTKKGKPGEMLEKVAVASAGAPSDNLGTYLNADCVNQINCKWQYLQLYLLANRGPVNANKATVEGWLFFVRRFLHSRQSTVGGAKMWARG